MSKVSFIPAGTPILSPYFMMRDCAAGLEWYKEIFGAVEVMRMGGPDGKIGHAELRIGDALLMFADEGWNNMWGPQRLGGSPVMLMLYVPDVDKTFHKALQKGATCMQALENKFYGDRSATIRDPFGHVWAIATHIEDVSPEEMERRAATMHGG